MNYTKNINCYKKVGRKEVKSLISLIIFFKKNTMGSCVCSHYLIEHFFFNTSDRSNGTIALRMNNSTTKVNSEGLLSITLINYYLDRVHAL